MAGLKKVESFLTLWPVVVSEHVTVEHEEMIKYQAHCTIECWVKTTDNVKELEYKHHKLLFLFVYK